MNTQRKPRPVGPQLKLPPQPKRSEYFNARQIEMEWERLVRAGKDRLAAEMLKTRSWEEVMARWKIGCDEARKAHKEKRAAWEKKVKSEKAEKARRWQAAIDECKAKGLPLPRRSR